MTSAAETDTEIRRAVEAELEWTPEVEPASIGVSVEDGAVTLSGQVGAYAERIAATKAALRVRGVRAVVDDLAVHPKTAWPVTEADVAKEVNRALRGASNVPDTVKAEVSGHDVTLTGEVDWNYQRHAAKRAVQYLRGVAGVDNRVTLRARPSVSDTQERIRNALTRNALLDARAIHVTAAGSDVTLTGTVRSWAEKAQAGHAAWASPHVTNVDNRIVVQGYGKE